MIMFMIIKATTKILILRIMMIITISPSHYAVRTNLSLLSGVKVKKRLHDKNTPVGKISPWINF